MFIGETCLPHITAAFYFHILIVLLAVVMGVLLHGFLSPSSHLQFAGEIDTVLD